VCLPCNAYISGDSLGDFLGFFLVGFGLFRPGAARAPLKVGKLDHLLSRN